MRKGRPLWSNVRTEEEKKVEKFIGYQEEVLVAVLVVTALLCLAFLVWESTRLTCLGENKNPLPRKSESGQTSTEEGLDKEFLSVERERLIKELLDKIHPISSVSGVEDDLNTRYMIVTYMGLNDIPIETLRKMTRE